MKKIQWNKLNYLTAGILAIFLCLAICFVGIWFERGMGITTGRCVVSDNDTVLLIVEDGYSEGFPVFLGYDGDKAKAFADWSTGDMVTVIHDGIRETYPGQTQMYFGWHKEEGSRSDISEDILKQLNEMGWIKEPIMASYEAEVEGKKVSIQLKLSSQWQAELVPYTGEPHVGCGLLLRSINDSDVEVAINYYPHVFGMCGTGVDFKDITMNNGQTATLATEKRNDGGIWVTLLMGDITGDDSFVANYHLTKEQKKLYEDDILDMLLGVDFQAEYPQDVIEHLTRRGQMDEPVMASLHRHVDGRGIDMQAIYRALWMYRPIDIIENAKIKCTGLQLYVEMDQEMMVDILFYPDQFTMEALPVISTETVSLDSDLSATIYTQKDNDGKELVTVVFDSFDHKLIAQYRWDQARKQRYHEEVRQILNTITFSIQ